MNKLAKIRQLCDESISDYEELQQEAPGVVDSIIGEGSMHIEKGRAELAEEILEILNGENN